MTRLSLCLALIAVWGCSSNGGSSPPRDSGASDASSPADAAADVPLHCASDRECSTAGLVCDTARGACVECNTATDCVGGRMCIASRCVMTTPCTTSRTCPGQVCSTRLGYCVDCEADVDCTGGNVCRGNVCVPPPRMCRSSRECSDIGLVCATARGQCVECVMDTDCPVGRYCGPALTCLARVCTPNSTACVSATRMSVCNAVGGARQEVDCPTGQRCRDNSCQAPVCTPGQTSCDPTTAVRRRCNDDGGGFTPMPCADGESCRDGMCMARSCMPGTATCASMTERRVCAADGLSTTVTACAVNEGCVDGACMTRMCTPGAATCTSPTTRSVCNADGFGATTMSCGATQRCAAGACVDLACTPGSSTCASSTTVRVCAADGSGTTTLTCPASSTCTGTMCSSWVCTPGTATCPTGATARTVCNADGLGTRSEPCAAPANASMARCGVGGACTFTCNAGFGDCNMTAADGCEAVFATDVANCGGCGRACAPRANMMASCLTGACDYRCNAGFGDCDGNAANGCEANLATAASCGRCGNACASGLSCAAGACVMSLPNYARQDAPPGAFVDACSVAGHSTILVSVDDVRVNTTMPFAFRYWGADVAAGSVVSVVSNGWLTFESGVTVAPTGQIPSTIAPNAVVAPCWSDQETTASGVCLATVGAAPARRFVVHWSRTHYYRTIGNQNFEAVFNEADLSIDFLYTTMIGLPAPDVITVGLENQDGTRGIAGCPASTTPYHCLPAENSGYRFVPAP